VGKSILTGGTVSGYVWYMICRAGYVVHVGKKGVDKVLTGMV
jgi:hypothetical protein